MPLVIFFSVLLGLFTLELLEPVQIWVIQPLTAGIAHVSAGLLQLFDSTVHAEGILISNRETGQAVSIQPGCNGVEAMICLAAAVMATPATWRQRLFGLGIGFLAIQALNILRVISLFYLLQWNQAWFEWAHLYLWQALIILDGLIVYLLWLRTLNRAETTEVAPA